jgi:Fur family ferric uptake transcriptional regulator
MQCGKVEEFHDPIIEKRQQEVAESHGYTLRDHHLVLYVECRRENCPNRKN